MAMNSVNNFSVGHIFQAVSRSHGRNSQSVCRACTWGMCSRELLVYK